MAGCWARSGSSLGCGSWPGLSCLIHRFRVLVNWPQEIRRPSSRRFVITSAWSVRLWRVAAIRTSLERPPPGSAASTAQIALHELAPMLGLSRADSVPNLTRRIDAGLRSHPRLADELKEIMARIGRETKNKV